MIKLRPCPFCGSECVNDTTPPPDMSDSHYPTYYWVCPDCVCCGPIANTIEGATDAWNNRVAIDHEQEMLDNISQHNDKVRGNHKYPEWDINAYYEGGSKVMYKGSEAKMPASGVGYTPVIPKPE